MNLEALVSSCLVVLCGLGPAACTQSEAEDPDEWETEDSLESTQSEFDDPDGREAEDTPQERDMLICDAIYIPLVTFTFTDAATGQAYCGPAAVTYEFVGGEGPITVLCECEDGNMVRQGWSVCHVNPPEGETSIISVSAPSYDVFVTEVTLPYICHPRAQVDVLFQPRTEDPPECAGIVTADLGAGPDGCPEAWFHGEQMCPQDAWCDLVLRCMAYSDWPVGTCRCDPIGGIAWGVVFLSGLFGLEGCGRPPAPSSVDVPTARAADNAAEAALAEDAGASGAAAQSDAATPDWSESDLDVTARFPSGKVWTARPKKELVIQGVACAAGTDIELYESGRLKSAKLASDQTFDGIPGLAWAGPTVESGVGFYESGKLMYIGLAEDVTIDGALWARGTSASFHENGRLRTGVLKDAHVFDGVPCAPSATTRFHENGRLLEATLAKKHLLVGETFDAGTEVKLAEDGTVEGLLLPDDRTVKSIPCEKLLWIEFHPNGALKQATLSKKTTIGGEKYRKGSTLLFDEAGNVQQNIPPQELHGPKY